MATVSVKKREERIATELPVYLDEIARGVTQNVSASGVFFETDKECIPGSEISFSIELDGVAGKMMLKCLGHIVRVEQHGGKVGVAARIIESRLEPVDEIEGANQDLRKTG